MGGYHETQLRPKGDPGRLPARRPAQRRSRRRPSPQDKKYTIYLSDGLIGNDWLQQMQRSAEVAVTKPPLARPRRSAHRDGREHGPGADQLAQQHRRGQARRDPHPCRLVRCTQSDDRSGVRRRHRRHQLQRGGERTVPLQAQHQLGQRQPRHPDLARQCAGRQGQDHRRPRPAGLADLGSLQQGDRARDGAVPRHRDRGLVHVQLRARRRAGGRRVAACGQPPDRRHPHRRLRHRRHPGAQGRRPAARADRDVRLQRLGHGLRHRDRARAQVLHLHAPALSRRPRRSSSRSTSSTGMRRHPRPCSATIRA